jgi:hypothetical protein
MISAAPRPYRAMARSALSMISSSSELMAQAIGRRVEKFYERLLIQRRPIKKDRFLLAHAQAYAGASSIGFDADQLILESTCRGRDPTSKPAGQSVRSAKKPLGLADGPGIIRRLDVLDAAEVPAEGEIDAIRGQTPPPRPRSWYAEDLGISCGN